MHKVEVLVPAEIEALIASVADRFGTVDILVNNVGIGSFGRVTEIDLAYWREAMTVGVEAAMWASRTAMPFLETSHRNIVNVASVAGITGAHLGKIVISI